MCRAHNAPVAVSLWRSLTFSHNVSGERVPAYVCVCLCLCLIVCDLEPLVTRIDGESDSMLNTNKSNVRIRRRLRRCDMMTTKMKKNAKEEKTNGDILTNRFLLKQQQKQQRQQQQQTHTQTHEHTNSRSRSITVHSFCYIYAHTIDVKRNGQEEEGEAEKKFNIHSQQTLIASVIIINPKNTIHQRTRE